MTVEIVQFLFLQGYTSDQIVVLIPYLGQLKILKDLLKTHDMILSIGERDVEPSTITREPRRYPCHAHQNKKLWAPFLFGLHVHNRMSKGPIRDPNPPNVWKRNTLVSTPSGCPWPPSTVTETRTINPRFSHESHDDRVSRRASSVIKTIGSGRSVCNLL
jgi:hypothetical protein